jgi:fructokinase
MVDRARADYGRIGTTPKPGWSGVDLRGTFARAFDLPIGFDTDVAGAALAEGRWGASQGYRDHVYLTIGTGIGGGIVAGGVPLHGAAHPEIGHIRVRNASASGFAGACPFHGDCLEGLVAGGSLAKRTGMKGEDIPPDHPVWAEVAQEIAELVAMLVLTTAPQRIVIGGGIGSGQPQLFPMIRAGVVKTLAGYGPISDAATIEALVVPPGLGADAGPLGAVALALDALK